MKPTKVLPTELHQYFERLEHWIDLEGAAERERMARRRVIRSSKKAEESGESVLHLSVVDHQTGLGGRILIDFQRHRGEDFPPNRMKVGSPVVITNERNNQDCGIAGVVSLKRRDRLQIAVEQWPDGSDFRVDLSPDETTRRRQLAAIARAKTAKGRTKKIRDVVLGNREMRFSDHVMDDLVFRSNLNQSQREAVSFALGADDLGVIHGPPGTGKTTTLAEVVFQVVQSGQRVLACAPSNTAVDNLLEKLIGLNLKAVRVGHPARVFELLREHTLDEIVENDPSTRVILEMRREIQQLVRDGQRYSRGKNWRKYRNQCFSEANVLRGQIRSLEKSVIKNIIDSAEVICTTTTIDDDLIGEQTFDVVVIDEACQASIPGTWQAILRANKLILSGDYQQLPPTIISEQAANDGMRKSLLETIVEREGTKSYERLKKQYRMHEKIMEFSSHHFYESDLIADETNRHHELRDDPKVRSHVFTEGPLLFIDTAGADYVETMEDEGESKLNVKEADLVHLIIKEVIHCGVQPSEIAVIAPYAAQVRLLREVLSRFEVEVDTVDGFQGREKDLVILTTVRSNDERKIGFLSDIRRTNVAITRARKKIIVVGDSTTLSAHPFYADLLEYFENNTAYSSVWEFLSA